MTVSLLQNKAFTLVELLLAIVISTIVILAAYVGLDSALRVVKASEDRWDLAQWHLAVWQAAVNEADGKPPGTGARATIASPFAGTYTIHNAGTGYQQAAVQLSFGVDTLVYNDPVQSDKPVLLWDGDTKHDTQTPTTYPYPSTHPRQTTTLDHVYPPLKGAEDWPSNALQHAASTTHPQNTIKAQPMPTERTQLRVGSILGPSGRAWIPWQPPSAIQETGCTRWNANIKVDPATGSVSATAPFLRVDTIDTFTPRGLAVTVQPMTPMSNFTLWNQSLVGQDFQLARDIAPIGARSNNQYSISLLPKHAYGTKNIDMRKHGRTFSMSEAWPLVVCVTGAR